MEDSLQNSELQHKVTEKAVKVGSILIHNLETYVQGSNKTRPKTIKSNRKKDFANIMSRLFLKSRPGDK